MLIFLFAFNTMLNYAVCFIFRNTGTDYIVIRSANDLRTGDHISWTCSFGVLRHYAIVLAPKGDRVLKVIHVTQRPDGYQRYEVVQELIDVGDHIRDGSLWRYKYKPDKCYDPDDVVMRAKSKIGKFEYDAVKNNCEHFARWCKNNENTSVQAEVAITAACTVTTAAIGTMVVLAVRRYFGI